MAAAPVEVQQRYEKWKDIVKITGPQGLKLIMGFKDEALSGNWKGFRSSRLNIQYRVIYKVQKEQVLVEVERAKTLAKALRCHPAVLVFPGWDVEHESTA